MLNIADTLYRWYREDRPFAAGSGLDDPSFLQPDRPMSAIGG